MRNDPGSQRSCNRQAGSSVWEKLQAQYDQDEREHQKQVTEANALAIHQRLESILRHLTSKISDAKAQNYDIVHRFFPSSAQPEGTSRRHYRLGLYMKRGGVIQPLDPNYLPEADYALEFTAQSEKGTIEVKYFARPTRTSPVLRSFAFIGELSNAEVDSLWTTFVDKSRAIEEERLHRS